MESGDSNMGKLTKFLTPLEELARCYLGHCGRHGRAGGYCRLVGGVVSSAQEDGS